MLTQSEYDRTDWKILRTLKNTENVGSIIFASDIPAEDILQSLIKLRNDQLISVSFTSMRAEFADLEGLRTDFQLTRELTKKPFNPNKPNTHILDRTDYSFDQLLTLPAYNVRAHLTLRGEGMLMGLSEEAFVSNTPDIAP